jgi:hypothetical protein
MMTQLQGRAFMVWFFSLAAAIACWAAYVIGDYRGFRRGKQDSYALWHERMGRIWTEPGPRLATEPSPPTSPIAVDSTCDPVATA